MTEDKDRVITELRERLSELEKTIAVLHGDTEDNLRLLSTAVEQISEGMAVADLEGNLTYVNKVWTEMHGYDSPNELIGRHLSVFHTQEQLEIDVLPFNEKAIAAGFHKGEVGHIRKDGTIFPTQMTTTIMKDQDGKAVAMSGLALDITHRKQAEEDKEELLAQMQHMQKLESLGILAGGIAHDFNNILMVVLGNADLALSDLPAGSGIRKYINAIVASSRRAANLCSQMLAYSGRGRFVVEALDLRMLVEEISTMMEVSISKKVVLKYDFAHNLPLIEADASQISQILLNLVVNASEAIGDRSGIVSISTGAMQCDRAYLHEAYLDEKLPEGLYVYIEVADTGSGMDEETLAKVFDPFFTTKFTGRGLGLSAVLGIVRGHKGAAKIYTEPGHGTTFKVLFPASGEALKKYEPDEQATHVDFQGSGTILLVDDEETIIAIGKNMLERTGFAVLTAADGREAVEIFREKKDEIVCVLLDLTMPHMGGEEAFREMRRIDKNIKVILSSGYNKQEVTQHFVGKGLAGFIQKPYFTSDLVRKLQGGVILFHGGGGGDIHGRHEDYYAPLWRIWRLCFRSSFHFPYDRIPHCRSQYRLYNHFRNPFTYFHNVINRESSHAVRFKPASVSSADTI
jgi:PAS domain S-box-containing protein